jgi:hypothetical protein
VDYNDKIESDAYAWKKYFKKTNEEGKVQFAMRHYSGTDSILFDGATFEGANSTFENGYCTVFKTIDGIKYKGLIDATGKLVVPYEYNGFFDLKYAEKGYIQWRDLKTSKIGFITTSGKTAIPAEFTATEGIDPDNLVRLNKGRVGAPRWGIMNLEGEELLPFEYLKISRFLDGYAKVKAKNGKYGYINKSFELFIKPQYTKAWIFREGVAVVSKGSKFGAVNAKEEAVIPFEYDGLKYQYESVSYSINNQTYSENYGARAISEEGYLILSKGTKFGCLKVDGTIVIPFDYDDLDFPKSGRAKFVKNGQEGYWNLSTKAEEPLR